MLPINVSNRLRSFQYIFNRRYSEIVERIQRSDIRDHVALIDPLIDPNEPYRRHQTTTYEQLYTKSKSLALHLSYTYDMRKITSIGAFIGKYRGKESDYVIAMVATWILGKIFVPLCVSHSIKEIDYFVQDSGVSLILHNVPVSDLQSSTINQLSQRNVHLDHIDSIRESLTTEGMNSRFIGESSLEADRRMTDNALVLYTSGTTGQPKGVLHTHTSLKYMIDGLVTSWEYTDRDVILHFLPLHHLHGVLNKLLCVLYAGGTVRFMESAQPSVIWNTLALLSDESSIASSLKPTIFMAVPTVYSKLLETSHGLSDDVRTRSLRLLRDMRLHVSGSAALPDSIMEAWHKLTGHTLLERYGMTELGMVLSNPYRGARVKGAVGFPLPHVEVRIVDDNERVVTSLDTPGELRVKGPTVFKEYLNRPASTQEAFDVDGWFKTGDIAVRTKDEYFKLLGRNSTDIIKRAGYKLSSLEIEREILSHPEILEAAVIGVPDESLGENVAAIISLRPGNSSTFSEESATNVLNDYLKDKLAHYKRPKHVIIVQSIPRNHMGKVNKKTLLKELNISIDKLKK